MRVRVKYLVRYRGKIVTASGVFKMSKDHYAKLRNGFWYQRDLIETMAKAVALLQEQDFIEIESIEALEECDE